MTENVLQTRTINELIKEKFFVPDYQRGYRWDAGQVTQLLEDLYQFIGEQSRGFYCLQPIVVTPRSDQRWEVIDGQQRLTTIYIILAYLGKRRFELGFETRQESHIFLTLLNKDTPIDETNIDFYHISKAIYVIKEWFTNKAQLDEPTIEDDIYICLGKQVRVIWYEVYEENIDPVDVFTRLNIGKIPLKDSELIKALFLNSGNFPQDATSELSKAKIASEWDIIEQKLQNDEFWAFVNPDYEDTANRIDFLFSLIARLEGCDPKTPFGVFHHFDNLLRGGADIFKLWSNLKSCFQRFEEWFLNHEVYHLVGYLITIKTAVSIEKIYRYSEKARKSDFLIWLKKEAASSIPLGIEDLDYEKNYEILKRVLLLFNLVSILQTRDKLERLSFFRFKKFKWELEHIHAQNSEGLTTSAQRWVWLQDHILGIHRLKANSADPRLKELGDRARVITQDNLVNNDFFENLFLDFKTAFEVVGEESDINDLSNLALLDKITNISVSNYCFDVKRAIIVEREKSGTYLLPGTRNVFLKYYTKNPTNLVYWSENDRQQYVEHIRDTFRMYFLTAEERSNV